MFDEHLNFVRWLQNFEMKGRKEECIKSRIDGV